jgi:hypothetical protein
MNIARPQPSNTRLNLSLPHCVAYVQQQMKQIDSLLARPNRTAAQQTKQEQFLSRHLAKTLL